MSSNSNKQRIVNNGQASLAYSLAGCRVLRHGSRSMLFALCSLDAPNGGK